VASTIADHEVLTLSEAAEYLRVSENELADLATRYDIPGRKIGKEWRFLKEALADWLRRPPAKERLLRHAGAAKDDTSLTAILDSVYHARGRPMSEDHT
jgi:excisionase family DNA binding protein